MRSILACSASRYDGQLDAVKHHGCSVDSCAALPPLGCSPDEGWTLKKSAIFLSSGFLNIQIRLPASTVLAPPLEATASAATAAIQGTALHSEVAGEGGSAADRS